MDKEKREVVVCCRMTKTEFRQLQHLAEILKMTESATIRKLIACFSA